MKKHICLLAFVLTLFPAAGICLADVTFQEHANRIDVLFDRQLFTSYVFAVDANRPLVAEGRLLKKPVLFPVYAPGGTLMTRGYPFMNIEGEKRDHPHHMGVYFTVDINEDNFWGNSNKALPEIRHILLRKKQFGGDTGSLSTLSHWIGREGQVMLIEERTMVFRDMSAQGQYAVDMDITLMAGAREVTIGDTKEGLMAVRVAPWLKEKEGTGRYLNAHGQETEQNVWGRRSKWMRLEGNRDGKPYGIVMLNHPDSVNYPTFWHARGYGCFSANPLGQGAFERSRKVENAANLDLTLEPGKPLRFGFRLIFYQGTRSAEQIEQAFAEYAR
jgi:hypothetical protein